MAVLVDLERVSARTADRELFLDFSLTVFHGDRIAVVGINGTGMSTLLSVIAGTVEPDAGEVRRGRGARVGYLEQEPALPTGAVHAAVGSVWESEAVLDRLGMGAELETEVLAQPFWADWRLRSASWARMSSVERFAWCTDGRVRRVEESASSGLTSPGPDVSAPIRRPGLALQMHHDACQRPGDSLDELQPTDHRPAQLID